MTNTSGPRTVTFHRDGVVLHPEGINAASQGQPNTVKTTRFNALTWLPLSLWDQLHRVANLYFLALSLVVCLPFSPTHWTATTIPFLVVVAWTALKDLYEDVRRGQDDIKENDRKCWRFDPWKNCFESVKFCEVVCGDILCTISEHSFPADLFLLYAPEGGPVFISSANLDGETSWKQRRLPVELLDMLRHQALTSTHGNRLSRGEGDDASLHACFPLQLEDGKRSLLRRGSSGTTVRSRRNTSILSLGVDASPPPPEAVSIAQQFFAPGPEDAGPTRCELAMPTASLWEANGSVSLAAVCARLDGNSLLPRGCILQECPWVLGVAAYVGEETKYRLNATVPIGKIPSMQQDFNRCLTGVATSLVGFCFYLTLMNGRRPAERVHPIIALKYFIILYHVIPVSLYICFEAFKIVLAQKIGRDPQLVDPRTGEAALARTSNLVEELGQVSYVFSDKTGTLTENEMVLAKVCLPGGVDLGDFREEEQGRKKEQGKSAAFEQAESMAPGVRNAREYLGSDGNATADSGKSEMRQSVMQLFLGFTLCHDLMVRSHDTEDASNRDQPFYVGSSPEEVAFADAASVCGIRLFHRGPTVIGQDTCQIAIESSERVKIYSILDVIEFCSDRKRMSVIVQEVGPESKDIFCITKGADNVMGPLLQTPFSKEELQRTKDYACLGLRTIVFAVRYLEQQFVETWRSERAEARATSSSPQELESRLTSLAAKVESSLCLAGITAIEDRLQAGVPEAVSTLGAAGVHFWMLTGDKTETAVAIARSCSAIGSNFELFYVTEEEINSSTAQAQEKAPELAAKLLQDVVKARRADNSDSNRRPAALVMDGSFFRHAHETTEGRCGLYLASLECSVCVCCRLSPQQKQWLIELVKESNPQAITLAIGDGANDVPMISAAHVGIGVRGKEGAQAVQASDVAISQFRFLVPTLLCHGRQNYRRVATFLCYYIYKHVALAMGDAIWAHQSGFTAKNAYPEQLMSVYNFISSLPIFVLLVVGKDVPDFIALASPSMYADGRCRRHFNASVFTRWVLLGLAHGSIAWLIPYYLVFDSKLHGEYTQYEKGTAGKFWVVSLMAFAGTLLCICIQALAITPSGYFRECGAAVAACLVSFVLAALFLGETEIGRAAQPELGRFQLAGKETDASVVTEALLSESIVSSLLVTAIAAYAVHRAFEVVARHHASPGGAVFALISGRDAEPLCSVQSTASDVTYNTFEVHP